VVPGIGAISRTNSGQWFADDGKFGLIPQAGALNFDFLYGECEKSKHQAVLHFEIDPKLYGDAVSNNKYVLIRVNRGQTEDEDIIVEKIALNEANQYGWSLEATVSSQMLDDWSRSSQLEFTVGVDGGGNFEGRQKYLTPNENRQAALTAFSRDCFQDQPTRKP
jgi:hypothetical protein